MKKSLLALAVLGAFAGAASAQSSVTVYGLLDLGITSTDLGGSGANGRQTGLDSNNITGSRIGFKGTEDLGGGLKANFVLEGGINPDQGTTSGDNRLFNRVSTIGLSGGFGAVNAGRQTTVLKDAHAQIDPFGAAGNLGNVETFFYDGGAGLPNGGRASNSVKYTSPSFSGFKAQAAYQFGEVRGDSGDQSGYELGLGYANGPLNVQFSYSDKDFSDSLSTPAVDSDLKVIFLGATYDFGGFKLHGAYADTKATETGFADEKVRNYLIGASVKVGAAGTVLASYAVNDIKTAGAVDEDSKLFAIAYTHDLSKRTMLYTGYAKTSNDSNADLRVNTTAQRNSPTAGSLARVGNDHSVFTVGILHKF